MEDLQELARRNAEIGVMNEIAATVNAEHDFGKIFEVFARQMDRLIDFQATSLLVLDHDHYLFAGWIMERGEEGGLVPTELSYPPQHFKDKPRSRSSASNHVMEHDEPIIREDWSKPGRFPLDPMAEARGIRSDVLFPLRFRDEVIGVLTLTSKRPNAFSETDFPLLRQLAEQLSPALSNARMLSVLEAANKEIGILNEMATAVNSERNFRGLRPPGWSPTGLFRDERIRHRERWCASSRLAGRTARGWFINK
jgi:GAF domain-containing protein